MSGAEVAAVVVLGTLVGLDLVSVPQMMIARPLVAGTLGGAVVGEPAAGLGVGAVLELFALETLPVGAARYPDWGPGAVAAGALVGSRGAGALPSGLLGVVLVVMASAWLGGWLMHLVRRANVTSAVARRDALEAGDPRALRALQWEGLARDAGRSVALTAFALAAGDLVSLTFANAWRAPQAVAHVALVTATVGVALASALRLFGSGRSAWWLAGGLSAGTLAAVAVR
jgi:PTS system mannose-specific IIC component